MGLRSVAMTDSPEDWDLAKANDWLVDHPDGGGDPETRRACEEIKKEARRRHAGPTPEPGGGRTKPSPYVSDDPPTTD